MNFTIEYTAADIELIGSLFDEQPYKRVADIVRRTQAQIVAQLQANEVERKAAWDRAVAEAVADQTPKTADASVDTKEG